MKRVNTLLRVSSQQQLHGDDIPVQRSECMNYIKARGDWQFQKEYLEKAVSGFKTSLKDREILQEILEDAREQNFDVLVVYMSDRIGRKEDESPVFVSTLNKLGIEVWAVKEGQLKTGEHIDKLLNYIRFWQAEGESRKTGARVKDAQETFAKAGKFIGGRAPLGYRLVPSGEWSNHGRALKKLVIDPETAPVIRQIYDYAVRCNYGALKIAKVLNAEKAPAPNTIWKACTVAEILKNPVYMGYIAYNRRQHSKCGGNYERMPMDTWILAEKQNPELAILPKEIWYKAQEMRENRKAGLKKGKERENETVSLSSGGRLALMGLVYCGFCKGRLTNGSKYDYWTTKDGERHKKFVGRYRCANLANGSPECRGRAFYRAEEIETIVFCVVITYLNSLAESDPYDEVIHLLKEQRARLVREREALVREREAAERDLDTLLENIPAALRGESPFQAGQLSELVGQKKEKLSALKRQIADQDREYQETQHREKDFMNRDNRISNWGELFQNSSMAEQKVMLSMLIERIDVKERDIRIKFRMNRQEFAWQTQGNSIDSGTTPYTPGLR